LAQSERNAGRGDGGLTTAEREELVNGGAIFPSLGEVIFPRDL
jgi:hypothetical protein